MDRGESNLGFPCMCNHFSWGHQVMGETLENEISVWFHQTGRIFLFEPLAVAEAKALTSLNW